MKKLMISLFLFLLCLGSLVFGYIGYSLFKTASEYEHTFFLGYDDKINYQIDMSNHFPLQKHGQSFLFKDHIIYTYGTRGFIIGDKHKKEVKIYFDGSSADNPWKGAMEKNAEELYKHYKFISYDDLSEEEMNIYHELKNLYRAYPNGEW